MNFADPTPYYVGHAYMERVCAKIEISPRDRENDGFAPSPFWFRILEKFWGYLGVLISSIIEPIYLFTPEFWIGLNENRWIRGVLGIFRGSATRGGPSLPFLTS